MAGVPAAGAQPLAQAPPVQLLATPNAATTVANKATPTVVNAFERLTATVVTQSGVKHKRNITTNQFTVTQGIGENAEYVFATCNHCKTCISKRRGTKGQAGTINPTRCGTHIDSCLDCPEGIKNQSASSSGKAAKKRKNDCVSAAVSAPAGHTTNSATTGVHNALAAAQVDPIASSSSSSSSSSPGGGFLGAGFEVEPCRSVTVDVKSFCTMEVNLARIFKSAVSLRRQIHSKPEPGFAVAGTVASIRQYLEVYAGVSPSNMVDCAENGLVVTLQGKGEADAEQGNRGQQLPPVLTVALRADTDALPMTEGNHHLPYRSQHDGVAHMCGHDGHVASLVAGGALLASKLHMLPKNQSVRLLFQPAEEGPGGALPMLRAGCLEGVDEVYGMHNWPTVPVGHMRVKEGALMAHVAEFTILVLGKGTHGSQPQEGVDPVLAGAALVGALHSIVSRSLHYQHSAVLSVTQFHAGEVNNVIPDTATLSGTIRDFDRSVFEAICKRIEEVAHGTCAAYGATATVTIEDDYPVVSNHQAQTAVVEAVGSAVLGGLDSEARTRRESLLPTPSSSSSSPLPPPPPSVVNSDELPMAGAEDFSYMLMPEHGGKPGCFFFLGGFEDGLSELSSFNPQDQPLALVGKDAAVPGAFASKEANEGRSKQRRSNCICHGTSFDFNDNLIPRAAVLWVRLVEARLGVALFAEEELKPRVVLDAAAAAAAKPSLAKTSAEAPAVTI